MTKVLVTGADGFIGSHLTEKLVYEGYKVKEIAKILKKNENTIKTWLSRGRELLKEKLKG